MSSRDFWNERFATPEYTYGTAPNAFLAEFLAGRTPGRLLLPAEGEGRNAVFAARLGWQVAACDFSGVARDKALRLAGEAGAVIDYQLADLADYLPTAGGYDLVACIYMHLPPELRQTVHHRLARAVAPGGYLLLEAFAKEQLGNPSGGPQDPAMLYSIDELREDFAGLHVECASLEEIVLHEGARHEGTAQVIRLIARQEGR